MKTPLRTVNIAHPGVKTGVGRGKPANITLFRLQLKHLPVLPQTAHAGALPCWSMDHYDAPWKNLIRHHLADFLAFCFPAVYATLDWRTPHCFPDHELPPLAPSSTNATMQPDLVAIAGTLCGEQVCLHLEIQGRRERGFAKRVFTYQYRLRDRFGLPVISLIVLADRSPRWRPQEFSDTSLGLRLTSGFATIKLLDFPPASLKAGLRAGH